MQNTNSKMRREMAKQFYNSREMDIYIDRMYEMYGDEYDGFSWGIKGYNPAAINRKFVNGLTSMTCDTTGKPVGSYTYFGLFAYNPVYDGNYSSLTINGSNPLVLGFKITGKTLTGVSWGNCGFGCLSGPATTMNGMIPSYNGSPGQNQSTYPNLDQFGMGSWICMTGQGTANFGGSYCIPGAYGGTGVWGQFITKWSNNIPTTSCYLNSGDSIGFSYFGAPSQGTQCNTYVYKNAPYDTIITSALAGGSGLTSLIANGNWNQLQNYSVSTNYLPTGYFIVLAENMRIDIQSLYNI